MLATLRARKVSETAVQFMVTLGGIGSIGQNPFGRSPFQHSTGVLPGLY